MYAVRCDPCNPGTDCKGRNERMLLFHPDQTHDGADVADDDGRCVEGERVATEGHVPHLLSTVPVREGAVGDRMDDAVVFNLVGAEIGEEPVEGGGSLGERPDAGVV